MSPYYLILQAHVEKRETELAALAADRIQQQADQSSEVISSLQAQLEKVINPYLYGHTRCYTMYNDAW